MKKMRYTDLQIVHVKSCMSNNGLFVIETTVETLDHARKRTYVDIIGTDADPIAQFAGTWISAARKSLIAELFIQNNLQPIETGLRFKALATTDDSLDIVYTSVSILSASH